MSTAEHVQPTGAVAGYRPERTLRLSVELRRQFKRRRTLGVLVLMVALPLILIAALQLGGTEEAEENARINLVDVATSSGLNFTLFVLFATTSFFLVVVYALFFGDTVASEAQDRKSTRLNSSHANISYAVFCLKKKNTPQAVHRKASKTRHNACGEAPLLYVDVHRGREHVSTPVSPKYSLLP